MVSGVHTPPGRSGDRRFPGWPVDAWSGFIAGVLASIVVLLLLTWKAETVAELTLGANPSCAAPRGLRQVEITDAKAGSTQARDEDGSQAPHVETDAREAFVAKNAIDDASNTVWIPEIVNDDLSTDSSYVTEDERTSREPRFLTTDHANRLTLTLEQEVDVRLVCVVNGAALWYTSYENWGRVRTVEVWGEDGDKKLGTLQSLGSEDFPNAQVAGRNLGDTRTITLDLIDAYAGIQVENFSLRACLDGAEVSGSTVEARKWFKDQQDVELDDGVLYRWPDGCILEPKVKAGIAEVRVYAAD